MPIASYLRVIGCEHDAATCNESYRKDLRKGKMKLTKAYLYTKPLIKVPKMTISTSTDVIFRGAWCTRIVAKQEDSHSTAPADKQINE